uniref:LPXTG cell wall anchor domain-containing protein n=1 Tax=Clostridium cuniculi TaxID=2548455 RepID=UPI0010564FA1
DTNPELPSNDIDEIPGDNGGSVTPPSVDTDDQEDTTTTPSEGGNCQKDDETVDSDDSSEDTKINIPYIGEITAIINNAITEGTISLDNNDTETDSIIKVNINNVELLKVQALFDSFSTIANDVKITSNDNYTTISFKVKKDSNPLLRESDEYVDIVLNIKNEYTDLVDIANNFVKKLVSSDNSTTIENDNIDNNEVELNTDNKVESNTTTNTVTSNTNAQTLTTTTLNKIKELPKTGNISSLPLIGTLTLSLGVLLRRNKK